jgi:hypothetical protein
MKKNALVMSLALLALAASGTAWWFAHRSDPSLELVLYSNVDLRQVELAFNNNERIAARKFDAPAPVEKRSITPLT